MVTIKEIAQMAGVSRGTVDRVLNNRGRVSEENARRIREIARSLGYQPNKAGIALAAQKKKLKIGVILFGADNPFFQKVLDGYARDEQNDIAIRLAKIRKEQGRVDEAITLFLNARAFLAEKIEYNPFFGDLNVMKWLIDDLYELIEVDLSDLDLYDLYYLMKEPCKVEFLYEGKTYEVESFREEEGVSVYFLGKWYRDIDELFKKAKIDGERVPVLFSKLYGFKKVD